MPGRKLSTVAFVGSLAAVVIIGACRDSATTGPSNVSSAEFASNLRLLSGDLQIGAVAATLPQTLSVRVVDAGGNPVEGASVSWAVISGGGTVNPPTGLSDINGLVSTSWTLGPELGENVARAYLLKGFVLDSVTFTATGTSGSPVIIRLAGGAVPLSAPVGSVVGPITFSVTDQFDHPVEGAIVTFAVTQGGGSVTPLVDTSDVSGNVRVSWVMGSTLTQQRMTATLAGQLPLTLTTTTTAGSGRTISVISGSGQSAAATALLPLPLRVLVTDQFGNPIAGETIIFNDSVGGGTELTPSSAITDASGIAQATWRLNGRIGVQVIRVRTVGGGGQTARFTATAVVAFRDVFAGNYFTCAIGTDDRSYCWGFGEDGQLGLGPLPPLPSNNRNAPTWPVTLTDTLQGLYPSFREIAPGQSHACAITIARGLMCWGFNPDNRAFSTGTQQFNAALITGIGGVRFASSSDQYTCLVLLAGGAICSGTSERGETGISGLPPITTGSFGYSFASTGQRHSCAMPKRNPSDDTLPPAMQRPSMTPQCAGMNDDGQLGDSSFISSGAPVAVKMPPGVVAFDSLSIAAGAAHTCALTADLSASVPPHPQVAGQAYCWGSNAFGQLGTGSGKVRDSMPQPVSMGVAGAFVRLYAGNYHTCGLTAAGLAFCWGQNNSAQFGNGTVTNSPTPTQAGGGMSFGSLALGELFTCGIQAPAPFLVGTIGTRGTVWCWGDNEFGQLGIGSFSPNATPQRTPIQVAFQQQ